MHCSCGAGGRGGGVLFRSTRMLLSRLQLPQMGQLPNGVRVMTLPDDTQTCAVGMFVQAGSRFETKDRWQGASWLVSKMHLKSNRKFSKHAIAQTAYDMGGGITVKTDFRETVYHLASCMKEHLPVCLDLLTATVLHADFTAEDLDAGKDQAIREIQFTSREPSRVLFEYIHRTAYGGKSIGEPNWPDQPDVIDAITKQQLEGYIRHFWRPERICIVVSGASQEEVLPLVQKLFDEAPKYEITEPVVNPPANYVGGGCMLFNTEPPPTGDEKFQDRNNTHVGLIFKGLPESHPNFMALGVLQMLLGGGTAFSQGGPGKGMYTKLYRQAVNVYGHWLWGIEAVMSVYSDCGLFGLYSQAPHDHVGDQLRVTVHQAMSIVTGIDKDMLEMAKNQYLSMIFMSCEERLNIVEGVGKSWIMYNKMWSPDEVIQKVRRLTVGDLVQVGHYLFNSTPTYVVYGNTQDAWTFDQVDSVFRDVKRQAALLGRVQVPWDMAAVR